MWTISAIRLPARLSHIRHRWRKNDVFRPNHEAPSLSNGYNKLVRQDYTDEQHATVIDVGYFQRKIYDL